MKIRLENVRLAFPNLFEARAASEKAKPKYSATFIFAPGSAAEKAVKNAMVKVAKEKWGGKAGEIFKSLKAGNKLCLQSGDAKAKYAGFEGNMFVNASNTLRPTVLDGQRQPLTFADGKPYAGCYVNGVIELWAQDNQYGKRINASLMGVQFASDGERLAGGSVASEDDFEPLPEEGIDSESFETDSEEEETDPFA